MTGKRSGMATRLLVFPNLAQMRFFFQREEWQALAPLLYPLGPHHWRLPTGDEVYVLTAASQETPMLLRRQQVVVYLFLGDEPVPPRVTYLLQMLETLEAAGLIEVNTMTHPTEIQLERFVSLPSPNERDTDG